MECPAAKIPVGFPDGPRDQLNSLPATFWLSLYFHPSLFERRRSSVMRVGNCAEDSAVPGWLQRSPFSLAKAPIVVVCACHFVHFNRKVVFRRTSVIDVWLQVLVPKHQRGSEAVWGTWFRADVWYLGSFQAPVVSIMAQLLYL